MNRPKRLHIALLAIAVLALGLACQCGWLIPWPPTDPLCAEAPFSPPAPELEESDLVGTWETHYNNDVDVDRLILKSDGTFKQIYEERVAHVLRLYSYETPWNHWWVEPFPDGRAQVHLEGARYFYAGKTIADLEGMGFGPEPLPWLFHDPFGDEYLEMVGELILNVRIDSKGQLLLHHMSPGSDGDFSMTGCQTSHFRRVETR